MSPQFTKQIQSKDTFTQRANQVSNKSSMAGVLANGNAKNAVHNNLMSNPNVVLNRQPSTSPYGKG